MQAYRRPTGGIEGAYRRPRPSSLELRRLQRHHVELPEAEPILRLLQVHRLAIAHPPTALDLRLTDSLHALESAEMHGKASFRWHFQAS